MNLLRAFNSWEGCRELLRSTAVSSLSASRSLPAPLPVPFPALVISCSFSLLPLRILSVSYCELRRCAGAVEVASNVPPLTPLSISSGARDGPHDRERVIFFRNGLYESEYHASFRAARLMESSPAICVSTRGGHQWRDRYIAENKRIRGKMRRGTDAC